MVERWSWLGDPLALDVANTVLLQGGHYVELLQKPTDLLAWASHQSPRLQIAISAVDQAQLSSFLDGRDAVLALLRSAANGDDAPGKAVDTLNTMLLDQPAVRLLTPAGTSSRTRLLDHHDPISDLLALAAFDTVELLIGPDRDRLSLCPAPSCGQLYLSDRANQRWCSDSCGNRARGARHHKRINR